MGHPLDRPTGQKEWETVYKVFAVSVAFCLVALCLVILAVWTTPDHITGKLMVTSGIIVVPAGISAIWSAGCIWKWWY